MAEIKQEQIDKRQMQFVESDIKEWLRHPVTVAYHEMLEGMRDEGKASTQEYVFTHASMLEPQQIKDSILTSNAQTELLDSMLNKNGVMGDFSRAGYLIDDEGVQNEKH